MTRRANSIRKSISRKIMAVLLLVSMAALLLTGCGDKKKDAAKDPAGSGSIVESIPVEGDAAGIPDLNGLWVQEDAGKSYMAATIQDGKIGAFFIAEGDEIPWTYWVGTYDAPATADEPYTWTSKNTYGGNGLLASGADAKDFTYEDGKLTYEVTIQGITRSVSLVRGEWDTANIPESAFGSVNTANEEVLPLEVADSGWCMKHGEYLYYYVRLYNPNESIAVEYPSFRITARDAENVVLGTGDQTLSIIYPHQEFVFGTMAFSVDETPAVVEFQPIEPNDYNLKRTGTEQEFIPLEVVNTGIRSERLVGEVRNPNDYVIDTATVVMVCRNAAGAVIDIDSTYVDKLPAGSSTPFDIGISTDQEIASYDVFANQW